MLTTQHRHPLFWQMNLELMLGISIKITMSFVLEQNDGLSTSSLEFDLEVYLNCLICLRLNVNEIVK